MMGSVPLKEETGEFAQRKGQSSTCTRKSCWLNLPNSLHPSWLILFILNDALVIFVSIVTLEDSKSLLKEILGDSEQLIPFILYLTMLTFKIMWLLLHLKLANAGLISKQIPTGKKRTGFFFSKHSGVFDNSVFQSCQILLWCIPCRQRTLAGLSRCYLWNLVGLILCSLTSTSHIMH